MSGHGLTFAISPTKDLSGAMATQYLGLFNSTNYQDASTHILAVEFDTSLTFEFGDIDDNHVGIDIKGLESVQSAPAAYFSHGNGGLKNISLRSGEAIQVWVDYDGRMKHLSVTLSPIDEPRPGRPLLSLMVDLSPIFLSSMYVGFTSSTGQLQSSHIVLGWSFKMNGQARQLDLSLLPKLPRIGSKPKSKVLIIGLPLIASFLVFSVISVVAVLVRWKIKYAEIVEDWERELGPHRFSYKDLFKATKGFANKELLGSGGFGMVYKGVLPASTALVAVKRVSHKSKQGMREFIAEIVSMGRLRHRNLVPLLGYCRREGELLLVYEFMPNGSLDKLIFGEPRNLLDWNQRFRIIKGVASGLFYLHEEWEQVVLHRDVKASNVLLDADMNGRLGDFGLARLYDHGKDPHTSHVVGTLGYIAPELTRTGKATTRTDVFSFGTFILEVACGRRPIQPGQESLDEFILVENVHHYWREGQILSAADPKLGYNYASEEMEMVLMLGLLCCHSRPFSRPTMRQVMQFLDGHLKMPEVSADGFDDCVSSARNNELFDSLNVSYCIPSTLPSPSSSVVESLLSGGR